MTNLVEILKKLLRDVVLFCRYTNGLKLRRYQEAVARAIVNSVLHHKGMTFVVIFPRQSGKNELQAQIQVYLLTLFSGQRREIVQVSPTWKPQTENAMHRLESVLSRNLVVQDRWEKHFGHTYQVGKTRLVFLSGSPGANIVGATANLLLSVDEAQDIAVDKYDKEIAPMAASTNATRVFWGTAWTSNTLLAREENAAKALQEHDGIQRVWHLSCDEVAAEVPAYGRFVAEQVAKLGRQHPMIRTQYYSEEIDQDGGLFPPERLALLYGNHPCQVKPQANRIYVMTLDVAGEDEDHQAWDPAQQATPGGGSTRDATALTLAEVDLSTLKDPALRLPSYKIVYRQQWVGVKHTSIYAHVLSLAESWQVRYLVCDATGVGAGLTAFLAKALGKRVIPLVFNSRTKSDLGWSFLALVDSGRLKDYAPGDDSKGTLVDLHQAFFQQLAYSQYEILAGPEKKLRWSVPDGTRDPQTGDLLHDDLVISAAMLSVLDAQTWGVPGTTAVVKGRDPLEDMKGF